MKNFFLSTFALLLAFPVLAQDATTSTTPVTTTAEVVTAVEVDAEGMPEVVAEKPSGPPTLELYHGDGCPHCARELAFLPVLKMMYPDLKVDMYEVWKDADNQQKFKDRLEELGEEASGVPTNIINGQIITGFKPEAIVAALTDNYGAPLLTLEQAATQYREQNPPEENGETDVSEDTESPENPYDFTNGEADAEEKLSMTEVGVVLAILIIIVGGLVWVTGKAE